MYVRKMRGQNKIYPVKMTRVQADLAKSLGLSLEEYVKSYVEMIAKQRRWKWFFERRM